MVGGTLKETGMKAWRHGAGGSRLWKTQRKDRRFIFVVFWLVSGLICPLTVLGVAL